MNNEEVSHLWANQSRESASADHFRFNGDVIYSYAMPIARHYRGVVLFTSQGYSSTTARHKSLARYAVNHKPVFTVADPLRNPCGADVKDYAGQINMLALRVAKMRKPDVSALQSVVSEANLFCETFGFKTRFTLPCNFDELRGRALAAADKQRKANAAREARSQADAMETVAKWLAGEAVNVPYSVPAVYLRVSGADAQTSKGAKVPLADAEKAFRFAIARRAHGWHRNGETFKIGDYHLDAVNETGIVAGCHRIGWAEIERFASAQSWI